jgi:hypothetical protein
MNPLHPKLIQVLDAGRFHSFLDKVNVAIGLVVFIGQFPEAAAFVLQCKYLLPVTGKIIQQFMPFHIDQFYTNLSDPAAD